MTEETKIASSSDAVSVPPAVVAPAKPKDATKREESDSPFSVAVTDVYEGPLDLLLDLIRKQNIDIYDIPIAKITAQYLTYVEKIRELDVNVAADFIYMAAVLIHIKSKMLLPRNPDAPAEEQEDPRNELVNRLLEHEKYKSAAQMLSAEAANRRCRSVQSFAQGICRRGGHRAGNCRRCDRSGEDFSAGAGARAHASRPQCR